MQLAEHGAERTAEKADIGYRIRAVQGSGSLGCRNTQSADVFAHSKCPATNGSQLLTNDALNLELPLGD